MADPTARALRLLELLQSAPLRTVAELADRLGVDERTVRRDVARLSGAGVHVESVRGRYGGYRLAPGRRVLPVTFSGEEVAAVFLGLAHAQAAGEPDVAAQTALAKIRRAMRPGDAERIDAALGAMTHGAPHAEAGPDPAVTLTLAEAVSGRRAVDLRYRDGGGAPSRRRVHPYDLVAYEGRWYLVALDTEKQQERTFRVDRVRTARALPETFAAPARSEAADATARLVERFADADYRWTVVLRVRATEGHLRAHLPPSVARLERLDGGAKAESGSDPLWYRAEIRAERLDWLPAVVAALDCEVVVDRPDELRDLVTAAARRMMASVVDAPAARAARRQGRRPAARPRTEGGHEAMTTSDRQGPVRRRAADDVEIRPARADEAALLSELALRSKSHWGYSAEFLEACREELTLSPERCASGRVVVAATSARVVGFYAVDGEPPEGELSALFVDRDMIGEGLGRVLLHHALASARDGGFRALRLDADPGAESFYAKHGAERVGRSPSGSIPGRVLPRMAFDLARA